MNFNEYQELASRTANTSVDERNELANYGLGIAGEAGEVADDIKKVVFHGHALATVRTAKELGDVLWYISQIARVIDVSLEEIAAMNIEKLKQRYPEGFDSEASRSREEYKK